MLLTAPAPRRRITAVQSMLTISAATLGATLIVAATAGGTYGLWADSAPINADIVKSGSLTLLVNGGPSTTVDSTAWSAMFPGDRVQQSVTLKNVGSVATDVAVATSTTAGFSSDYKVEISRNACPLNNADIVAPNSLLQTAGVGIWAPNQELPACIEVTLLPAASALSQGKPLPLNIVFTATQRAS